MPLNNLGISFSVIYKTLDLHKKFILIYTKIYLAYSILPNGIWQKNPYL